MKIGTKSILYGYHQFLLHPLLVALAWWKLYGFPWDPRLWVAFFVHDLGYWGSQDMDGPEGEYHVFTGAKVMGWLFDNRDRWTHLCWDRSWHAATIGRFLDVAFGHCPQGRTWYCFTFYHSRFIARHYGVEPSRLCYADKYVTGVLTPIWLQLLLMNLTGEVREYMHHDGSNGRTPGMGKTQRQWCEEMRAVNRKCVEDSRRKALTRKLE